MLPYSESIVGTYMPMYTASHTIAVYSWTWLWKPQISPSFMSLCHHNTKHITTHSLRLSVVTLRTERPINHGSILILHKQSKLVPPPPPACWAMLNGRKSGRNVQVITNLSSVEVKKEWIYTFYIPIGEGVSGGAVGWGTASQAGRSRVRFPTVSLEFFIDIILPAALWPRGWFSL